MGLFFYEQLKSTILEKIKIYSAHQSHNQQCARVAKWTQVSNVQIFCESQNGRCSNFDFLVPSEHLTTR